VDRLGNPGLNKVAHAGNPSVLILVHLRFWTDDAVCQPLVDDLAVFLLALGRAGFAKIDIPTIEADDALAGRIVEMVRWDFVRGGSQERGTFRGRKVVGLSL